MKWVHVNEINSLEGRIESLEAHNQHQAEIISNLLDNQSYLQRMLAESGNCVAAEGGETRCVFAARTPHCHDCGLMGGVHLADCSTNYTDGVAP